PVLPLDFWDVNFEMNAEKVYSHQYKRRGEERFRRDFTLHFIWRNCDQIYGTWWELDDYLLGVYDNDKPKFFSLFNDTADLKVEFEASIGETGRLTVPDTAIQELGYKLAAATKANREEETRFWEWVRDVNAWREAQPTTQPGKRQQPAYTFSGNSLGEILEQVQRAIAESTHYE
ncbi:MAG: hypothetical protein KC496_17805, partial [Anaerolineae bacterium]|nr:hypothetical protein [Anaerolineae bacterium]